MTRRALVLALAALALAVAGCGDDDDSGGAGGAYTTLAGAIEAPASDPAGGVPDVAVEYLDELAGSDVTGLANMLELAADGSPAELYARYQLAWTRYAGGTSSTSDVRGDQVEQCVDGVNVAGETRRFARCSARSRSTAPAGS